MEKWAHFSPERVKQINNYYEWVTIELFGAISEEIKFYTANLGLTMITTSLLKQTFSDSSGNVVEPLVMHEIKFDRSQRSKITIH